MVSLWLPGCRLLTKCRAQTNWCETDSGAHSDCLHSELAGTRDHFLPSEGLHVSSASHGTGASSSLQEGCTILWTPGSSGALGSWLSQKLVNGWVSKSRLPGPSCLSVPPYKVALLSLLYRKGRTMGAFVPLLEYKPTLDVLKSIQSLCGTLGGREPTSSLSVWSALKVFSFPNKAYSLTQTGWGCRIYPKPNAQVTKTGPLAWQADTSFFMLDVPFVPTSARLFIQWCRERTQTKILPSIFKMYACKLL